MWYVTDIYPFRELPLKNTYLVRLMYIRVEIEDVQWKVHNITYGLPLITIFGHESGHSPMMFTRHKVVSKDHGRITPWMIKNIYSRQPMYHFFLHALLGAEHRANDENWLRSIALPLSFAGVVLWRHPNTYYNVISTDCLRKMSLNLFPCRRREAYYQSSTIESDIYQIGRK